MNLKSKIYRRMRELVQKGWTKNREARNSWNEPVEYSDPSAETFCILGARNRAIHEILHATDVGKLRVCINQDLCAIVREKKHINYEAIHRFNDNDATTKADVVELLDTALARSYNG